MGIRTELDPEIRGAHAGTFYLCHADAFDVSMAYLGGEAVGGVFVITKGAGKTTREALLESVSNQKLKNAIDQIYRPGATIGDGGLADAIRHQLSTGELVGGKDHLIKGAERVKNLENIIKKEALNVSVKNFTHVSAATKVRK